MPETPDTSYYARLARIVNAALIEQDSRTYHGDSGDTEALAHKTVGEILGVIASEEKERKRQELLNPRRGIVITSDTPMRSVQIGHGGTQINYNG